VVPARVVVHRPVEVLAARGAPRGAFAATRRVPAPPRAIAACVGWLGYDLGLDVEAWPLRIEDDFPVPVCCISPRTRRSQEFAPGGRGRQASRGARRA
jgi:xanthosine utilization system XapX-like protein